MNILIPSKARLLSLGAAVAFLTFSPAAFGDFIDGSSNNGLWSFTGAGATNATPFILGNGGISFTNNSRRTGTFAPGASLAAFDGFWTASFTFFLPADATDVFGSFSNLGSDDRVLLYLNGNLIGAGGLGIPTDGTTIDGLMKLTAGGADQPWSFNIDDSSGSGSNFFNIGGTNTLLAIMNNTGSGVIGTTKTFLGDGDGANFRVTAGLTYTPEPAGTAFVLAGGLLVLGKFRDRLLRR